MSLELSDVINQSIAHYLSTVYTCLPVVVVNYTANKKMVTVKPLIKVKFQDDEEIAMPNIYSVPVIFPGTKNTVIQFELKAGDTGLAFFSTRSLEVWLKGNGKETSAGSPRKFSLNDAMFLPGLFPFSAPGKVAAGSADLEILHYAAKVILKSNGDVEINGNTRHFVTHTELDTALQTMLTALNAELLLANGIGTAPGTATGTTTLDISTAKTEKVKTG